MRHFQEQLHHLEIEQNQMLEREAEVLKVELQQTMDNEKAVIYVKLFPSNHLNIAFGRSI